MEQCYSAYEFLVRAQRLNSAQSKEEAIAELEAGSTDPRQNPHQVNTDSLTDPHAPKRRLLFADIMKEFAGGNLELGLEATITSVRGLPRSLTNYVPPFESLKETARRKRGTKRGKRKQSTSVSSNCVEDMEN